MVLTTVGVDLAAEPEGTAVVAVAWEATGPRAAVVFDGRTTKPDDGDLLRILADVQYTKIGVDCPFGWPVAFVDAIVAHDRGRRWPGGAGGEARRHLRYRSTDYAVHARFPDDRWPLSVSSDRIGVNAMRWAAIADQYEAAHGPIDRTGAGRLVEVYPAAAMRRWNVLVDGYKGADEAAVIARRQVVDLLNASLPGLVPPSVLAAIEHRRFGDDVVDALIAALSAGVATAFNASMPAPAVGSRERRVVEIEGWIAVPEVDLTALATLLMST